MCVCAYEEAVEKLLVELLGVMAKLGYKWEVGVVAKALKSVGLL